MWVIYIIFWGLLSWFLAYLLTRSLIKHYTHDLKIKSKRTLIISNSNNPEEKELALELFLKNLGPEPITITEVGIFYKTTNKHFPFLKLINKSNIVPITLEQKSTAKFTQLYSEFQIDIDDIQRSYLQAYAKDKNNNYYYIPI